MSILRYYETLFGVPARTARYKTKEGQSIFIYKWDERGSREGVAIYATAGASDLKEGSAACEYYLGLQPEVDDVVDAVAEAALHGNGTPSPPQSGDTITLSFPLWRDTGASSFLFTDGDGIIPPLRVEGRSIRFLKLVPLFPNELVFKKENGESALWKAFETMGVEYWNANRQSSM